MVIDLVIVTNPKPLESRQLMMPPSAVFAMAPPKVLQGAVRSLAESLRGAAHQARSGASILTAPGSPE
jgi:hypothetical protein